ncbi:GDSL-type esterase/lipase family protein [Spongiactinospora sp. TRM90649]|uniref:GDSL-type esterase/lipase family protein n=1 Tax=Spongiactinospora sp. TRM90649 TaxID=3031114 RepID=UPI0023F66DBC|nr:GDSL-type esterase/lipase family protein [Spongiactinospora sp. TRM90649]MDF5751661.1 SGNH/GDSL hydrolase family protein [Spongiactinospora sp. TRM90649]
MSAAPLRRIALDGGPVVLAGAMRVERTPNGLIPRRLPEWTEPQITDPYMRLVALRPAGVRLVFATDADAVELDVNVTRFRNAYFPPPPVAFDLVVDGERVVSAPAERGALCSVAAGAVVARVEGSPETIRFDGLGRGWKDLELWLPQASHVELRELRADGDARPGALPARRWIHYGSSISHCAEAYGPASTWPALVARRAGLDLTCLAFAGSCQLDPFVARTIRDAPADLISLKVGINVLNLDTMKIRTFVPALHGFLDTVREGHPDTPLLVVSPVTCPSAEDRAGPTPQDERGVYRAVGDDVPGVSLTLRTMRALIEQAVAVREDPNLSYLDGTALLGPADAGALYDGLHPDAEGYLSIGERFHERVFGPSGPWHAGEDR